VKILQRICFDRLGVAPNERLLEAMDGNVSGGGPSARVNAGKGWKLANRYGEALFVPEEIGRDRKSAAGPGSGKGAPVPIAAPGKYEIPLGRQGRIVTLDWESGGKGTAAQAKRLAAKGDAELFDAAGLALPLTVRPLRAGDRIRPFGRDAGGDARGGGKRVKEILIDRKVPREERWGRPVLCDANGAILWIPGVLRSAHAPVTPKTRKTAFLRVRSAK
jgi:tRNA(Ile)-lysidine synthase